MKLGFTTYQLPQNLNFEESIRLAKKTGCAGIDFRTGNVYKHGVEVSLSPEERRQMRRMLEDNYLELASINSEYSFDNPDENERRKSIEGAKQCCLLASDFGSRLVRLFGNIIRTDDAHETVKYVSDAIREVCDYAATLNVTCLIEMHGDFNYYGYALEVVHLVDRPNIGILYNCDLRDLLAGSCIDTFKRVEKYVKHIHCKDLDSGYPFTELFEELYRIGYDGYLSAELRETSDPERVLTLHNIAVRSMLEVARRNACLRA